MSDPLMLPPALRSAVESDLRPVTPLPPPALRVVWLVPFAVVLLVASVLAFGLRMDAPHLGLALTWGASALQTCLGLVLVAAALREAVPGTTLSRSALALSFGASVLAVLAVTGLTWSMSQTYVPARAARFVWTVCFGATILTALPALAVCSWLVARAFPLRPALAGALYGLGCGLMADAGWRLFCHYSSPAHVFGAHTAAVAVTTLLGVLIARLRTA